MLPDEMEAEKNRKIILAQADEIEILKRNVRQLQGQYQSALVHNKRLIEQNAEAMAIIGHKQQELDAMEQARDNAYDDISGLIKEDLECR
tara:strand:+ start:362 stop:631 length:270 start_codon:yes stop_codon:yes gene_type:complete